MLSMFGLLKKNLELQGKLPAKWKDTKSYYDKLYLASGEEYTSSEIPAGKTLTLFYPYKSPLNIEEDLTQNSWSCTLKVNINALDSSSNANVYLRINSRTAGLKQANSTVRLGNYDGLYQVNRFYGNSIYNSSGSSFITTSELISANNSYWIRTGFDSDTSTIINSYSLDGINFVEINSFKQTFTESTKPNTITISNAYKDVVLNVSDLEFIYNGKYLFKRKA